MPIVTITDSLCEDCRNPASESEVVRTIEDDRLCPDCAAELARCADCAAHTRTTHQTMHDGLLCTECVLDWWWCFDCRRYARQLTTVADGPDVCVRCADTYRICDACDLPTGETEEVDGGDRVCPVCVEDHYHECTDCSRLVPADDTHCESCDIDELSHHRIHDHDFKPAPILHGDGPLFLGLELEVKAPDHHLGEAADTALDHLNALAYLKEDSSIRPCGFELVTHPMDFEYASTEFPWQVLDQLRLLGCHTDDDVGIHVHVSRTGFDGAAHIYRWMKFVYRNQQHVTILARRRSSRWAEFSGRARNDIAEYAKGSRDNNRFHAINVCPRDTFELRIFASSLQPQQVQAALAFTAASVEYTRHLTAAQIVRRRGWEWAAFTTWLRPRPQYAPLFAELEALACVS